MVVHARPSGVPAHQLRTMPGVVQFMNDASFFHTFYNFWCALCYVTLQYHALRSQTTPLLSSRLSKTQECEESHQKSENKEEMNRNFVHRPGQAQLHKSGQPSREDVGRGQGRWITVVERYVRVVLTWYCYSGRAYTPGWVISCHQTH